MQRLQQPILGLLRAPARIFILSTAQSSRPFTSSQSARIALRKQSTSCSPGLRSLRFPVHDRACARQNSTLSPPDQPPSSALPHRPAPHRSPDEPIYQLTFTCKPCETRSSHTISKQGYHHGTVLITCPGCKNRHLISDHLHIFSDQKVTLEDIMKKYGEDVQRGSITPEGDVEFWPKGVK